MAKRGRPRALVINPIAVDKYLGRAGLTRSQAAEKAGIAIGQLLDAINDGRCKGIPEDKVRKLADVIGAEPEEVAPEFLNRFRSVRPGDPEYAEVAA